MSALSGERNQDGNVYQYQLTHDNDDTAVIVDFHSTGLVPDFMQTDPEPTWS